MHRRWLGPVTLTMVFAMAGCKDSDADGTRDAKDCAPEDFRINPDAEEVCDGVDNNCNGQIDEDVSIVAYWDRDLDGFGDPAFARRVCVLPPDGSLQAGDCNDTDPKVFPGAEEICNLLDDDCDGQTDEDVLLTFYRDDDGDGHGVPEDTTVGCFPQQGFANTSDDCNDSEPFAWTGADEICDGIDNDCNGEIDEGLEPIRQWEDADGDGYGNPAAPILACGPGIGVSDNALDCDDTDASRSPDTIEGRGNGIDDDCDGYLDEFGVGPGNEFATFEDALLSAPNGAVIQFDQGFHIDTIDLTSKRITLAGEGCDRTTLYADAQGTTIIADDDLIERMTVSGGSGTVLDPEEDDLYGGGLLVQGNVTVRNLCVEANTADFGGGIAVVSGSLDASELKLVSNATALAGAGLYVGLGAQATVWGSLIADNDASSVGGGVATFGGTTTITNTVIAGNTSLLKAAGLYGGPALDETDTEVQSTTTLDQVTMHANTTDPTRINKNGEAIYYDGGILDISHSLFTGHPEPYVVIETTGPIDLRRSYLGYRGNAGPDADYESFQQDRIAEDVWYILDDPSLSPKRWDLRLRAGSGFVDVGDPNRLDPDGTIADLGAFGGPMAPEGWDFGLVADEDADGLLDGWEIHYGTNRWLDDSADDDDGDALTHAEEQSAGSDPLAVDTDGDGVEDGVEVSTGADPARPEDQAPVVAGLSRRSTLVDEPVLLSAEGSFDPNGDALTYTWTVVDGPVGSAAAPSAPGSAQTSFTPDLAGTYLLEVAVSDGTATRTLQVTVVAQSGAIVPDDYPTLQAAIDAGEDTLGIRPGRHVGVASKTGSLTLIGLGSAEEVVLDGGGYGSTVLVQGGSLVASQLTVTGGFARYGGGIRGINATIELYDVTVHQNYAYQGGGLWVDGDDSWVALRDVRVIDNIARDYGGGLWLSGENVQQTLLVENGWFAGNQAAISGGAMWIDGGTAEGDADFYLYSTVFLDNEAPRGAVWWHSGRGSDINLWNSTLAHNRGDSLTWSDEGRNIVLSDVLVGNEVTLLWDGAGVEYQHFNGVWADPTVPAFYDPNGPEVTDPLVNTLVTHVQADPLLGALTHDGDSLDDVIGPRLGSPVKNAGFLDHVDRDTSRADAGGCGGPLSPAPCARFAVDADGDAMSDGWEVAVGLDPTLDDSADDADGDGLANLLEHDEGLRPDRPDTDSDGILDGAEHLGGAGNPRDDRDHRPVAMLVGPGSDGPVHVEIGETIVLDGSASADPDGGALTYRWRIVGTAPGSQRTDADLVGANQAQVTFSPDRAGAFRLGLTVNDGTADSRERIVWVVVPKEVSVPGDYATLDEAVAEAEPGDIIRLGAGTWPLAFNPRDLPLTIAGTGLDQTFLEPLDSYSVFKVDTGGSLGLRDLTITGGQAYLGSGVRCEGGALEVKRVRIERGVAYNGGGIYAFNCAVTLTDVTFEHNHASWSGGALYMLQGSLDWTGGGAFFNSSGYTGGAMVLLSVEATLRNLHVHRNQSEAHGAAILTEFSGAQTVGFFDGRHLTITGNRGTLGTIYRVDGIPFTLTHSSVVDNTLYGLYDAYTPHTGLTLHHNNWFLNTVNSNPLALSLGATDLRVNPGFVAYDVLGQLPDDVHLMDNSPLRDAGDTADDPDGSLSDIGAYGGALAPDDWDVYFRDTDGDGMADGWEESVGLDPAVADSALDPDGDTLTNLIESTYHSDPFVTDTDADGVSDELEVGVTNPVDPSDFAPSANAGPDKTGTVGNATSFTGTGVDPQTDPVSFRWILYAKPGRSALKTEDLVGADTNVVSITPDHPGQYVLQLVTSDGAGFSKPDFALLKVAGDLAVPEDYPTLAQAVKAAESGATITIGEGTWPAKLDLDGKDLSFVGAGRDRTVLDGEDTYLVLKAVDGEIVSLQDLTITRGRNGRGGALWLDDGASLDAINVSLAENTAGEGGAAYVDNSTLTITDARIVDNLAGYRGGALNGSASATLDLSRTLLAGNRAINGQGGAIRMVTGDVIGTNLIFSDNHAYDGGAIHLTSSAAATLDHVTATYNYAFVNGSFIRLTDSTQLTLHDSIITLNLDSAAISESSTAGLVSITWTLLAGNDLNWSLINTEPPVDGVDGNDVTDAVSGLTGLIHDEDWTNDDWSLDTMSTAIDAGDPAGTLDPDGSAPDKGAFGGAEGDWTP